MLAGATPAVAGFVGKLLILGDSKALENGWVCEAALLLFVYESEMV